MEVLLKFFHSYFHIAISYRVLAADMKSLATTGLVLFGTILSFCFSRVFGLQTCCSELECFYSNPKVGLEPPLKHGHLF